MPDSPPAAPPAPPTISERPARRARSAPRFHRLRAAARWLRHAPDRALHARRRRAALRRLSERAPPASILFLCQGNIVRSPFAAALCERCLPAPLRERIRITSLGFISPGRPSPREALETARAHGIDLSAHRSGLLSRESVSAAGLVVVMSREQERAVVRGFGRAPEDVLVLGDLDPHLVETRAVEDPWGRKSADYARSYARIVRCVRELARALAAAARDSSP
jgi:low molecular weight protein-tyrosine phosphatase